MAQSILEVKHLKKQFGGVHAVDDLTFDIHQGEILGLIGPNGCGKSTTVNLISGVYAEDSGEIVFNGTRLTRKHSMAQRSRMGIGRTFQSPKPFIGLTVFDSVFTIAMQTRSMQDAKTEADRVLELTGLTKYYYEPCEKLSVEKRKALDMTRILVTRPKILMLDEVMAGLNPSEMAESIQLIHTIHEEGITILLIEHVMKAVVELAQRVVVMNSGTLLTMGAPEEVLNDSRVIAAYLGDGYHA